MTSERRFSEDEVAFILERAAAAEANPAMDDVDANATGLTEESGLGSSGMTLQQLTDVAREAGLSPEAVVRAAGAVQRGDLVPTTRITAYGLPIGVGRIVEFSRRVTDAEWERMVVALRETFQARGTMRQEGSLRSWNNGNLTAMLEPTATGHRLRLTTRKGDASGMISLGITMLSIAAVMATIVLFKEGSPMPWWSPGVFVGIGLAAIGPTLLRLPRWARTRAAQMEAFADDATRILEESDARKPEIASGSRGPSEARP
jgi:hypothetical protein